MAAPVKESAEKGLPSSASISRQSCDRCYAIKERCVWSSDSGKCMRCLRLQHTCQINRKPGRPGRRPRKSPLQVSQRAIQPANDQLRRLSDGNGTSSTMDSPSPSELPTPVSSLSDSLSGVIPFSDNLDALEQRLVDVIFGSNVLLEHYLLGPSFTDAQKQALVSRFTFSTPLLKDCMFACAGFFSRDHHDRLKLGDIPEEYWIKKAAKAISSLRSIKVSDWQEFSALLMLGSTVVTFAPYLAGSNNLTICRYILNLIKPVYFSPSVSRLDPVETSFLVCLVYTETVCCLFAGETPTFRYEGVPCDAGVDRYLGLSVSLIPIFYDICEINQEIRTLSDKPNLPNLLKDLDRIEDRLNQWQPTSPAGFLTRFTQTEVLHIVQQTQFLRMTALMICHRLRFAYDDTSDGSKGLTLARTILSQLEIVTRITNRSIICSELAFITACFELQDEDEQESTLSKLVHIIGDQIDDQPGVLEIIRSFWLSKRRHKGITWSSLPDMIPGAHRRP